MRFFPITEEDREAAWCKGVRYGDRMVLTLYQYPDDRHSTRKHWQVVDELHVAYSAPGSSSKTVQVVPTAGAIYGKRCRAPSGRSKSQKHANVAGLLVDGKEGIAAKLAEARLHSSRQIGRAAYHVAE